MLDAPEKPWYDEKKSEGENAMYDILIVDDEQVEREVIRFLMNRFQLPFAIAEAANGREALDLLGKRQFHVLFTDIKMPFVDGLELARQAREVYPDLPIVFFSGYDDFEYARQALSLRIISYILKPVKPEDFQKTMTNVLEQLQAKEVAAKQETLARQAFRRSVLLQVLNGIRPERLQFLYPQGDCSFLSDYYRLMLVQLQEKNGKLDCMISSEELFQVLPEDCHCVALEPRQYLILFFGRKHRMNWYQDLTDRLSSYIQKKSGSRCEIEFSSYFNGAAALYVAYRETEKKLRDRTFFQAEEPSEGAAKQLEEKMGSDELLVKQIDTDIRVNDSQGLRQHMSLLLEAHKKKQSHSVIYVRYFFTNVLKLLLDHLAEDPAHSFDEYAVAIQENDFVGIEQMLLELTEKVAWQIEGDPKRQSHAVLLTKQYIHRHFAESLSLDILADNVHLSARYLSALFMEEENIGINRYIKKIRMQKAQELLRDTNMKVSEISTSVGYTNLSYFCKSFQDAFGMTPDKYRSLPAGQKGAADGTEI